MKTIFEVLIIIGAILWIACPSIHSDPFKITFDRPFLAIGVFFIIIGMVFIIVHSDVSTYERGLNKGCEISREAAKQVIKDALN